MRNKKNIYTHTVYIVFERLQLKRSVTRAQLLLHTAQIGLCLFAVLPSSIVLGEAGWRAEMTLGGFYISLTRASTMTSTSTPQFKRLNFHD